MQAKSSCAIFYSSYFISNIIAMWEICRFYSQNRSSPAHPPQSHQCFQLGWPWQPLIWSPVLFFTSYNAPFSINTPGGVIKKHRTWCIQFKCSSGWSDSPQMRSKVQTLGWHTGTFVSQPCPLSESPPGTQFLRSRNILLSCLRAAALAGSPVGTLWPMISQGCPLLTLRLSQTPPL